MGLTNKKENQLKKMPYIETKFEKSKDGRFLIHKTIFTTIRPLAYFEKILSSEGTKDIKSEDLDVADGVDADVEVDIVTGAAIAG